MRRNLIFSFLFSLLIGTTFAQTSDNIWGVGIMEGGNSYIGNRGSEIIPRGAYLMGLSLTRYLTPSFNLGLDGTAGNEKYVGRKKDLYLLLSYKFNNGYILPENAKIAPYLAIGQGLAKYYPVNINDPTDFVVPLGLGIKVRISENWSFQYQGLFFLTNNDARDGKINSKPAFYKNDKYLENTIGFVYNISDLLGRTDSDHDGVWDRVDKCPNTPPNVPVDVCGCPMSDRDSDGVPDAIDRCPDAAGPIYLGGCPDTDGDNIPDIDDSCPNLKGLAKYHGCPDEDGDGIPEYLDWCPKLKGLEIYHGCPDSDGDSIPDFGKNDSIIDRCPFEKGSKELHGCPDRDSDGVADIDDACPDIPGIKANKGCPPIKEATVRIFQEALTGIQFETGKDVILPVSFPILDKVVQVMIENPTYNLQINGHTDNVGEMQYNLNLSDKRAASVVRYLNEKGVAHNRMNSKGFGPLWPIADNTTDEGRSKNRRVEFIVIFEKR